jgi:outer membrane murein-binding lipoprotein Lpp
MTIITITPQLKVTMLKHLVAGKNLDFVAQVTRVPRDDVLDIVSKHGYPNHDRMAWAVDMLIQGGDKIPESQLRTGTPLDPAAAATPARTAGGRPSNFALIPPATITHIPPATADLLHQGKASPWIRTQNLAAKIHTLLGDLAARLADEQAAAEAKAQADRESARIASRIATLQAEIDKLKRKPAKTTGVSHATRPVITGEHSCTTTGCDRTFPTIQGAVTHRRRAHEGFNPHAKAAS